MSLDLGIGEVDLNVTHNLSPMWREAGIRDALYESNGQPARAIGPLLRIGLVKMLRNPDKYRAMNPPNGWGDYDGAIEFLTKAALACADYPDAPVRVWA